MYNDEQSYCRTLTFHTTMIPTDRSLLEDDTCPACYKVFSTTKGRNCHLLTALSCKWYGRGKIAEGRSRVVFGEGTDMHVEDIPGNNQEEINSAAHPNPPDIQIDEDLFHFIPDLPDLPNETGVEIGDAGPGPQTSAFRQTHRVLDDEDDTRVTEEHQGAGWKIRMGKTLFDSWQEKFSGTVDQDGDVEMEEGGNKYAPFASEMDWRIARWAVKDGIGHNSFNRLLEIPGVSSLCVMIINSFLTTE
jgi:hypothetical protein